MKEIIFCLSLVFTLSCKTKQLSPITYNKEMIVLGNGGGFTGMATSYYLLESGEIFRSGMNDTSFVFVGKLDSKTIKHQFSTYKAMNFDEVKLDDPGNRYFYIIKKKGKEEHKIQWGRSALEDQNLSIFHKNIMGLIKSFDKNSK